MPNNGALSRYVFNFVWIVLLRSRDPGVTHVEVQDFTRFTLKWKELFEVRVGT